LTIESDLLRAVVLPEVGGMIHQLVHKPTGSDLLYHHPRLQPRPAYYRAPVDDWWAGGVIEGLPTCFACMVDGESLPDFGEVWSQPWSVHDVSSTSATVSCTARIWPLRITRAMSLDDHDPVLRLRYRLESLGDVPVAFLWGVHPTVPVGRRTQIQVPARLEHLAGEGGSAGAAHESAFNRGPVPFAELATPGQRFSYLTDFPPEAWWAVWDPDWPVAMGMRFSAADFPMVGMWLLDGWRGLRAITLEPWIGWPGSLEEAIGLGRARTLGARGRFETELSMIAFTPSGPIRGFGPDGRPIPA
jgi:galactose mutarotase-like enzyme